MYITLLHLFVESVRDNAVDDDFKADTLRKNLHQLFIGGAKTCLKDLVVELADNITLDEWLTHVDRRAETHCLKIIDDLGSYSSSFNKWMLRAELDAPPNRGDSRDCGAFRGPSGGYRGGSWSYRGGSSLYRY
ncbi:hypothetical protein GE21DRAFT_6442 [Neurospora crassa]|uniref:Uncharacterized protein n=1 Tax=Neurospora crassa (strain ATCC 24698 / 74-OR23-1A / CBS 708.71 / DSM 1257 / FGSC 987) TaxID=367110 RepID=Q7S854_NEUCR|nr:hypothetical protein NCU07250 [Neurospora crassa OR74A]EAA32515.1 hypothetical protein NCU07250 [Neurospora crassa OR74A]KHE88667.1 hypothetical protein GE21DRAFT_6442 [Neurospora crassa]|eukprot:XP_961751.1 hypothetical protein NCU07250 [Neurospora crassa OR74A]